MNVKKLPNGISNFAELITNNYYYVDKTEYIEKLENYSNRNIFFLRPRKFGKSLFTDTLSCYYDVNKKDKFETLFQNTYIGKNPTKEKNSYHILKFNFSGIDTQDIESTMKSFKNEVLRKIEDFITRYELDFYLNQEMEAEDIIGDLYIAFKNQKPNQKIYVLIDEYDHFANELLSFNFEGFKKVVTKNGKVRKFYEKLKEGTESVVGRIFITGVAPITLDGMTSGFNIAQDLSQNLSFHSMMGFNEKEIKEIMVSQEISEEKQTELLPIMKENYDGYMFHREATEKLYNSNMSLYFLNEYAQFRKLPDKMMDMNIASDYSKIGNMLKLCTGEKKLELLEKTISGEEIATDIVQKFNPEIDFGDREMLSMLYYLGYLTMSGDEFGIPLLKVPNVVMKEIYADYFMQIIKQETNLSMEPSYIELLREIALEGKIDKVIQVLKEYLSNLSNRDFIKSDEKYLKILFYSIAMNFSSAYWIKSEPEYMRNYPDILLLPKETEKNYCAVMIEFKYLKKGEKRLLKEKQKEAREQINGYAEKEEMKKIKNLKKYAVVAVVDEIYVEEVD